MKRNILRTVSFALAAAGLAATLAGCNTASAATAEEGAWPEKIVIVQMPNENNPGAVTKHGEFVQDLAEHLGIEVQEMEGADYTVGVEAMASGNIDVMLVSPMSYYQAKQRAGAELLVSTPLAGEYRTVFFTRAGNDEINSLADLEGHSFAFVDAASSSGYMYPKAKLVLDLDLEADLLENSGYFFDTVAFAGSHDAVVTGVWMGDYDAGAAAGLTIEMMAQAGMFDSDEFKILDQTDLIPNPAYVVRGDLPDDLKAAIKEFFLGYDNGDYFEQVHDDASIRFIDVSEDDYQIIYDTLSVLNIEGE